MFAFYFYKIKMTEKTFYCSDAKLNLTYDEYSKFDFLIDLVENTEDEDNIVLRLEGMGNCDFLNLIKFILNNPNDYFTLNERDRRILERLGYYNPLNYPEEYFKISEEERFY